MKKNAHAPTYAAADRLLDRYLAGYDTETGFILDVLNLTDESVIEHALKVMPGDLLERFRDFVDRYTPQTRVFRGPGPNIETVRTVRRLLGNDNGAPQRRTANPNATVERATNRRD